MSFNYTEEVENILWDQDKLMDIPDDFIEELQQYPDTVAAEKILNALEKHKNAVTKTYLDYLKRYLHNSFALGPDALSDDEYTELILREQKQRIVDNENRLTKQQITRLIKGDVINPTRDFVFKMAFALGMDIDSVNECLQKGLKLKCFDAKNPQEMIYWYCLKNNEGSKKAAELFEKYNELIKDLPVQTADIDDLTRDVYYDFEHMQNWNENEFMNRLIALRGISDTERDKKGNVIFTNNRLKKYFIEEIVTLYNHVKIDMKLIKAFLNVVPDEYITIYNTGKDINISAVVSYLYGDYIYEKKISEYAADKFNMPADISKSRIYEIKLRNILDPGKSTVPSRYDLITLCMFNKVLIECDDVSFYEIEDYINFILEECGMMPLSPNSLYEFFIMLCAFTKNPIEVFREVYHQAAETNTSEN